MLSDKFKSLFRNSYSRNGEKLQKNKVNLEYYKDVKNLGDLLSPIVCDYMLSQKGLTFLSEAKKRKPTHLTAIGSILGGRGNFDMTVWGSGMKCFYSVNNLWRRKFYQKLDIRAVRGPVTREALVQCGISCPKVYGDPAILMPKIYSPETSTRKGTVLITHYLTPAEEYSHLKDVTFLDIKTDDYKGFIDSLACAEKVISSSLHGIILAETYGTPAVFLQKGIESETLKFYDWYYSTGRKSVVVATSIDEALKMESMPLPTLEDMQNNLMNAFPYDLWQNK